VQRRAFADAKRDGRLAQGDLKNVLQVKRLGQRQGHTVEQGHALRLRVQGGSAFLRPGKQAHVLQRHRRQVGQALDEIAVLLEAEGVLQLRAQAQHADGLHAGDHRHEQRAALAALVPRAQVGVLRAGGLVALELVEMGRRQPERFPGCCAGGVERRVTRHVNRRAAENIGLVDLKVPGGLVVDGDTHAREGHQPPQAARHSRNHLLRADGSRDRFHHFVEALLLLGCADGFLGEARRLDGCRRLRRK